MLRGIRENYSFSPDEPSEGEVVIGRTMGCGCCSNDVPLTVLELDNHIADLQKALDVAHKMRELLAELELYKAQKEGAKTKSAIEWNQRNIDTNRAKMLELAKDE
jgi:hypothetical protein